MAAVEETAAAASTPAEDGGAAATDASVAPGTKKTKRWFPLESNPSIMNKFIEKMGFPVDSYRFTDVFSTEEWALEMVPGPVLGVVFLYPIKESTEEFRAAEKARIEADGQVVDEGVYYMKQTVGNACGTVGILHACGNVADRVPPNADSYLENFMATTKGMNPDEIAEYLNNDDAMEEQHGEASTTNEAGEAIDPSTIETNVNTHFICFSEVCCHPKVNT